MGKIWAPGEQRISREMEAELLEKRTYVFDIIERDPGPFLDTKRSLKISGGVKSWTIYYLIEGYWKYEEYITSFSQRQRVDVNAYLKLMEGILLAMEEAEEKMIMTGSFEISPETIWYHKEQDQVKFMFVPTLGPLGEPQLWKSCNAPEILLRLLSGLKKFDPGFDQRWPLFQKAYGEWKDNHTGLKTCIRQIRSWRKEFPEDSIGRNRNRYQIIMNEME